ncbi:MAG TPA: hypothetical protein VE684_12930 [Crenalkalicoccus sp.]|jgi:hypothetical protein|nr:hypothetical protein [Crenalkalicoccus sp.]
MLSGAAIGAVGGALVGGITTPQPVGPGFYGAAGRGFEPPGPRW